MPEEKKIASFDFDQTLNQTRDGHDLGYPSLKCLNLMDWARKRGYRIYIFTARKDLDAVRKWCKAFGVKVDEVTNIKPPADVSFDDRAVTFSNERPFESMVEDALRIIGEKSSHQFAPRKSSTKAKAFVGRNSA